MRLYDKAVYVTLSTGAVVLTIKYGIELAYPHFSCGNNSVSQFLNHFIIIELACRAVSPLEQRWEGSGNISDKNVYLYAEKSMSQIPVRLLEPYVVLYCHMTYHGTRKKRRN